jgi:uncharacterized protein YgiB involved in biofilm formation
MKRSKNAKLTLMVAGSALALASCGEEPRHEAESYPSLDACKNADVISDSQCDTDFQKAMETHEKSAPRYESQSLCEQEFSMNNCERRTNQNGASFWSPFMTGFLVSHILDSRRNYYYSSPYYRTRSGGFSTWDGAPLGTTRSADGQTRRTISTKTVTAKPKAAKVMTRTSVISRGGFGSRTSSRSSSGRSWGG